MRRTKADTGVSVVTCTNRPQFFMNIIKNFLNQKYHNKELIIIINKNGMGLEHFKRITKKYDNISVFKVPEHISLGQCLNCGISRTRFPLIAKFDDDDFYSPYYLNEQVKALTNKKSDIVGKHACVVYLVARKMILIRSPLEKNKFLKFVQGGTILFKRKVLRKVRFSDRSVGEDVTFLSDCNNNGYKTYSTSPYNYVYIRRKNKNKHTWKAKDRYYLIGSKKIGKSGNYRKIAIRKI